MKVLGSKRTVVWWRTAIALTGILCHAYAASPSRISVHPERALLRGSNAHQTLLVTAVYTNGVEVDVTSSARFFAEPAAVVHIGADGLVTPLRDGKARVRATFGGKTAYADVMVSGHAAVRPVSFLQDVAPIITQKGCTGSNCHGSVRGQAGFKLSLFGARPDLDYEEIAKGDTAAGSTDISRRIRCC